MVNIKGEVDYKLPKRMKKRRQLDALVDTMKLPRSRKNSSSAQELLDYQSDSSEIDEFSLPPPNSKRKNRCCVCQSMIARISLFIISMACLTTCVGLIWVQWHIRHELNTLRNQVHAVQTSDKDTPDMIMKLQTQISMLNKTVLGLKQGMDVFESNFKLMSQRLNLTEESNKELKASVLASKDYIDTPEKLKLLTNTVATMGSEISDQTKKSEDHDKRLASLEAAKVTGTQIPENVDSQTLRQQLGDLQKIVEVEMGNHTQEITLLSTQISQLENLLKSPSGQPVVEVSSAQSSFKEQLSTLTEKVNSAFENFTKTYPPGSIVDKGEFLAFKEDTLSNVQKTNQTLFTLSDEFDALAVRLTTVDDAIINITSVLNTIKKGDDKGTNSSAPEPAVTTAQTEVTESKILHSDNIKDVNELNKLMEELSSNGQPVDLMELKKHGIDGDNEAFVLADTNSDQKYSKEELVQALKLPDGSMRCKRFLKRIPENEKEEPNISTEAKTVVEIVIHVLKRSFAIRFGLPFLIKHFERCPYFFLPLCHMF